MIRPTVNIVSITRWPVRQWRIAAAADRTAPEPFYRLSGVAARTSRCAPATPSSQTVRRRTGRDCGRRPVRGVRSEEGKSGLEARQAPSLGIRHRRTGQLVTETIPPCPSNHPRRRRHRQHTRRKTRFSTLSNPGPPTRTPARWGGNREPIPDRPVSRRYVHVENALNRLTSAPYTARRSHGTDRDPLSRRCGG